MPGLSEPCPMWNRCSGRAGLSWGSSCALKGMGILVRGSMTTGLGKEVLVTWLRKGVWEEQTVSQGGSSFFSWAAPVGTCSVPAWPTEHSQAPVVSQLARFLQSRRGDGFVVLLGQKGPPQWFKALWKKPKQARKAKQTWTAAGHFGLEQCVTLTSSKLYFLPELSPCLSLRGSFSMEKRLLWAASQNKPNCCIVSEQLWKLPVTAISDHQNQHNFSLNC